MGYTTMILRPSILILILISEYTIMDKLYIKMLPIAIIIDHTHHYIIMKTLDTHIYVLSMRSRRENFLV